MAKLAHAFPLDWPAGQPQTKPIDRGDSVFKFSFAKARDHVIAELGRLGVPDWNVVLSTNVELRKSDGLPMAGRTPRGSPGVAVYFRLDKMPQVFACDKWSRVEDNMHAVGLTIEALRGIERWGSGEMMRRAFQGFKALPPGDSDWRVVFDLGVGATLDDVEERFAAMALDAHPDLGGKAADMARLNVARTAARAELNA